MQEQTTEPQAEQQQTVEGAPAAAALPSDPQPTPAPLPKYRSHKVVEAAKILSVERDEATSNVRLVLDDAAPIVVSETYLAKHDPQPGGYFVRYEDGYESWSPAEAFESGYVLHAERPQPTNAARSGRELFGHKVNGVNDALDVYVTDEPGSGGACHRYVVTGLTHPNASARDSDQVDTVLLFQNGPVAEAGVNGITHEALLAILIDRLECFQRGRYANEWNAQALQKLQHAQTALQRRTLERVNRGVEGTHQL